MECDHMTVQPKLLLLCILLANGLSSASAVDSTTTTTLPNIVVEKIQLAQTHILPTVGGRYWKKDQSETLFLRAVSERETLVLIETDLKGGSSPLLQVAYQGKTVAKIPLISGITGLSVEDESVAYPSTSHTWHAVIPAALMKKGTYIRVIGTQVRPSAYTKLSVLGSPVHFDLYSLPFYLFGATDNTLPFSQTQAPDAATQREMFAKWPISTLNAQNHPAKRVNWPYVVISPRSGQAAYTVTTPAEQKDGFANMSAVLNILGQIRQANGDGSTANQYYAPIIQANKNGQLVEIGGGLGGGHVGTGDHRYSGIFIHEQGHAFGLPHAGESYNAHSGYPYAGGSVNGSLWGYDLNKKMLMPTVVPRTASQYANCKTQVYAGIPRQLDALGQCIKQDPMQSGSGDQANIFKFAMFSDYSVARMQRYFEGLTTINSAGVKNYAGGRIFVNANMPTGYARWDSIDQAWVAFDPKNDPVKGLYGVQQNFPVSKNVPVYTIAVSVSKAATDGATQIYPIIGPYTGNLLKTFDPTVTQDRTDMTPNTSAYPWYCRGTGCDYTLRVTYTDGTVKHVALQGGFRPWFGQEQAFSADVTNPTNGSSFKTWAVNVPATSPIQSVELLDTPLVWTGVSSTAPVLASRQ
jgi:hypothetical protein